MQSLKAQMQKDSQMGSSSVKESTTLLDALGYDVNSVDDQQIISTTVSYDNNVISNAAIQGVQSGASFVLNLQEQQVHLLNRIYITGEVACVNGVIPNMLALFRGAQYTIGKVTKSTGTNEYLNQIMFNLKKKKSVEKDARGLALALQEQHIITDGNAVTQTQRWLAVDQAMQLQAYSIVQGTKANLATWRCRFAVKLTHIFPELSQLSGKGKMIALLNGNTAQFVIQTTQPNQAMLATNNGDLSYTLNNIAVVRQMTKQLTMQQQNSINAGNFVFQCMRGYQGVANPMGPSNNITMSIPRGSRPRALVFAAFPGDNTRSTNTATGVCDANTENIVTARLDPPVYSRLNGGLHFCPALPISQILLTIAGHTLAIPLNLIQNFDLWNQQMGYSSPYDSTLMRSIKQSYVIDLTRFGIEDVWGSAQDQCPVNFQLFLSEGTSTISGQDAAWSNNPQTAGVCSFQRYQLRAYLLLNEAIELDRGQYKHI